MITHFQNTDGFSRGVCLSIDLIWDQRQGYYFGIDSGYEGIDTYNHNNKKIMDECIPMLHKSLDTNIAKTPVQP